MPRSATSRPNLRSARIVNGRSWSKNAREPSAFSPNPQSPIPNVSSPSGPPSPRAHADGTRTAPPLLPLPIQIASGHASQGCARYQRRKRSYRIPKSATCPGVASRKRINRQSFRLSFNIRCRTFDVGCSMFFVNPPRVPTPRQTPLHRLSQCPMSVIWD